MKALRSWWMAKVRYVGKGDTFFRLTPNVGIQVTMGPWQFHWCAHCRHDLHKRMLTKVK